MEAGCIRRFEGVARRSPGRIAAVEHDAVVNYARPAGLAARRLDAGVRPGDRVGLVTGPWSGSARSTTK